MKKRSKIILTIIVVIIIVIVIGSLFLWWFFYQSPLKDNSNDDENNLNIRLTLLITNDSDKDHEIVISFWNYTSGLNWNFTCYIEKNSNLTINEEIEPGEIYITIDFTEIDDKGNHHPAPTFSGLHTYYDEENEYFIHINGGYTAYAR